MLINTYKLKNSAMSAPDNKGIKMTMWQTDQYGWVLR